LANHELYFLNVNKLKNSMGIQSIYELLITTAHL